MGSVAAVAERALRDPVIKDAGDFQEVRKMRDASIRTDLGIALPTHVEEATGGLDRECVVLTHDGEGVVLTRLVTTGKLWLLAYHAGSTPLVASKPSGYRRL